MINLKETATAIVDALERSSFNNIQDCSGYYLIKEDEERDINRAIDVSKRLEDGKSFYVIFVSYEDESSDWETTEELTFDSLLEKIIELAESEWKL